MAHQVSSTQRTGQPRLRGVAKDRSGQGHLQFVGQVREPKFVQTDGLEQKTGTPFFFSK